jgi:hypothetical protein
MDLDQLFILVERLRKEAIGEPKWIAEKGSMSIEITRRGSYLF